MEGLLALARGVLLPKPLALPALSAAIAEYLCVITAQVSHSWSPFLLLEPSGNHSHGHHAAVFGSKAVLHSVPPMQSGSPPVSPRVRIVGVLGPETTASSSMDGVLLDIPLPSDLNATFSEISQMENFKVLLFSEALEPREAGLAGIHCHAAATDSLSTAAEAGGGGATTAYEIAEAHAARIETMGIRLVACRELGSLA